MTDLIKRIEDAMDKSREFAGSRYIREILEEAKQALQDKDKEIERLKGQLEPYEPSQAHHNRYQPTKRRGTAVYD